VRTPVLDVFRPAVWASARLFFGIRFEGTEHIPREGPLLITPNHVTFADPPLVSIPIRLPIHYMAWDRLFDIPGLAWLIRRLRAFPVDIESADPRATRAAVRLLDDGHAVMIFPEASRSPDGKLQRFKLGAFRLACARRVPILPVTIVGGHESWPPGRILPRPGRLTIVFHPVITPSRDSGDLRHAARELADRVRAAVASRL
jgi:1-acyl-sn-glycerol-3-phosphate acyltransferase